MDAILHQDRPPSLGWAPNCSNWVQLPTGQSILMEDLVIKGPNLCPQTGDLPFTKFKFSSPMKEHTEELEASHSQTFSINGYQ